MTIRSQLYKLNNTYFYDYCNDDSSGANMSFRISTLYAR